MDSCQRCFLLLIGAVVAAINIHLHFPDFVTRIASAQILEHAQAPSLGEAKIPESWMPKPSYMKTNGTDLVGVWKMTFAVSSIANATRFSVRYLGARDMKQRPFPCMNLSWVKFAKHINSGGHALLNGFQYHFVEQWHKLPSRHEMSMHEAQLHKAFGDLSVYHNLMDTRVVMVAEDLDPVVSRFIEDEVVFASWANADGSFSVLAEMSTGLLVEVLSKQLSVLRDLPPKPCPGASGARLPKAAVDAARLEQLRVLAPESQELSLKALRFSYASTDASRSAEYVARYFDGKLLPASGSYFVDGSEDCKGTETRAVTWKDKLGQSFQFLYVSRHSSSSSSSAREVAVLEEKMHALHGNFSERSAVSYDVFMDYHAGLLVKDCAPYIAKLRADSEPFFLASHAMHFLAVFIKDPSGYVHEVVCPLQNCNTVCARDELVWWDFCHPNTTRPTVHGLYTDRSRFRTTVLSLNASDA